MPDIVIDKQFVTTLAKRLKKRFGPEVKHMAVIEEVAAALGWRADALMHKLKSDEKARDEAVARAAAPLLERGVKHFDVAKIGRDEQPLDDRGTVFPSYLVCLEDGKKVIMLERHLRARGLMWDQYLAKHGLPANYPRVAPGYGNAKQQTGRGRRNDIGPNGTQSG